MIFLKIKKTGLIFLIFYACFCFLNLGSSEAVVIRITQTKVRLAIPPGGSQAGTITLENPSAETVKVRVYLEDWVYTEQDGSKEFSPPGTQALSCAKWIIFSPAELNLSPRGKQNLNYKVTVPPDATGGHYAVLFFETEIGQMKDEEGVGVRVMGRMGTLFYIESEGTVIKKAIIDSLKVSRRDKDSPLVIRARFKNTGNVDITAGGTFNILDKEGMVYARGQFKEVYTFAGDEANLESLWQQSIPKGIYDLVITLDLAGLPYIKEAQIEIDSSGKVLNVSPLD